MLGLPSAFICYSWDDADHKDWVAGLAARLRGDGVDVTLDRWRLGLGDRLHLFMEQGVRDNDFVLVVCTPRLKERVDRHEGAASYEIDIMIEDCAIRVNDRKYIPILRSGDRLTAVPHWLQGKIDVDLRGATYSQDEYHRLISTLHGLVEMEPPLGSPPFARTLESCAAGTQWLCSGVLWPEFAKELLSTREVPKALVWSTLLRACGYHTRSSGERTSDAA